MMEVNRYPAALILVALYLVLSAHCGHAQQNPLGAPPCSKYHAELRAVDFIKRGTGAQRPIWKGEIVENELRNVEGSSILAPLAYLNVSAAGYQQWGLPLGSGGLVDTTMPAMRVEKEFEQGTTLYRLERPILQGWKYGPLMLAVYKGDSLQPYRRVILVPDSEDLEIDQIDLIRLKGRTFFFVKERYRLYLVDIDNERSSPAIRPGSGVDYGEDAISGMMDGFQFFDGDDYLIGIAVNYGLFCFNITDLAHPKELLRYSARFSDHGQPYFFLELGKAGRWAGIIAQSDTTKKSTHISNFYTETKKAAYLFQNAALLPSQQSYTDPAMNFDPKSFVVFSQQDTKEKKRIWVVNLRDGTLLKGRQAELFLRKTK